MTPHLRMDDIGFALTKTMQEVEIEDSFLLVLPACSGENCL